MIWGFAEEVALRRMAERNRSAEPEPHDLQPASGMTPDLLEKMLAEKPTCDGRMWVGDMLSLIEGGPAQSAMVIMTQFNPVWDKTAERMFVTAPEIYDVRGMD